MNCSDFNAIDFYFDGNGSVQDILRPLIVKITNYLMGRIESLINKVIGYEIRLRSHLMKLVVYLIETMVDFTNKYSHFVDFQSYFCKEEYIYKNKYD